MNISKSKFKDIAYLISQGHNSFRSSRTFEYLIISSSHNTYATLLHTPTAREAGISPPQTMEEAPAGNYFMQSPAATEVETTSSPWPEEEAPTGFPLEDYMQYSSGVTNRVPVKEDCPDHAGVRPMQMKSIQI